MRGYKEINYRAMKLLPRGGYLATCSCSHFVDYELFTQTIGQAARNVHKRLRQVEYRTQAPDHPILWDAEDSYYLKFYIFQVCDEKYKREPSRFRVMAPEFHTSRLALWNRYSVQNSSPMGSRHSAA